MKPIRLHAIHACAAASIAGALTLASHPCEAQVRELALGSRSAIIGEPFSDVVGLAELRDGRVLVTDRIEKSLWIADFRTGARALVGRNGAGPNEYQLPFGPVRWRADTLLLFDASGRKFLRITESGALSGAIALPAPTTRGVTSWAPPRGASASGYVYWDAPIIEMQPEPKRSTRARIMRWLPSSDAVEVVQEIADHADFEHDLRMRPMPQADAWVVTDDGRVGVLSAAEYRLRWYKDGALVAVGEPVPYTPVRVTAAERDAFRMRKAQEPTSGAMLSGPAIRDPAAAAERTRSIWADSLFPERIPPFESNGALLAPTGEIWVRRTGAASEARARVDILDQRGALRAFVRLPPRARLLAVGKSAVYVLRADDDGLQTLERYEMPAR